jgi:hypothetical protein
MHSVSFALYAQLVRNTDCFVHLVSIYVVSKWARGVKTHRICRDLSIKALLAPTFADAVSI